MDDATAGALNDLNLAFYREHGAEFSAKRSRPWQGWTRLLEWIPRSPGDDLSVLDVGCGNARFGRFLAEHRTLSRYSGVDASEPLLAIARGDAPRAASLEWKAGDFVNAADEALPEERDFDLAVLFGVLHGVPGRDRRLALLDAVAARLGPEGLLVFTCWGFADDTRLAGRILPWERAPVAIDTAQLDPSDHLLPWGSEGGACRYSATIGPEERAWLGAGLSRSAEQLAGFAEDGPGGDLNHYTVLRIRR